MGKWYFTLLVIPVALGIFLITNRPLGVVEPVPERPFSVTLPTLTPPALDIVLTNKPSLKSKVWTTFQNYLKFAQAHDLAGLRTLSYQISATCNDPAKEKECFDLMDSVYLIGSPFKLSEFTNFMSDGKQIMLYTDGPDKVILFFTRDSTGDPQVLGMRFCRELENSNESCVMTDPAKRDLDGNGWWDSIESLFYSVN